jgi:hypothetical protein
MIISSRYVAITAFGNGSQWQTTDMVGRAFQQVTADIGEYRLSAK